MNGRSKKKSFGEKQKKYKSPKRQIEVTEVYKVKRKASVKRAGEETRRKGK